MCKLYLSSVDAVLNAHHICESHVEEEARCNCCYPLFGCGIGGDRESDVEADKGGQSAAHVQQQSFLYRHAAVQQHSKITCTPTAANRVRKITIYTFIYLSILRQVVVNVYKYILIRLTRSFIMHPLPFSLFSYSHTSLSMVIKTTTFCRV